MPLLLTTWSFGLRAGRDAWRLLAAGGAALDAVEVACIDAERDPTIDSVGYGGLPDRAGGVSLDACVMTAPRRCGGVCAVRAVRHPASAARLVMERTDHVLLAGPDADAFALAQGVPAAALLAPAARSAWERWCADPRPIDQGRDAGLPLPAERGRPGEGALFDEPVDPNRHHDTIGVLALDARGGIAGACSTSGTPYKLPGRVGDSPIVGHGLYVDPEVGAATATGAGELVMGSCSSFLAVERLRAGDSPQAAVATALRRILQSGPLRPHHQVAILLLRRDGAWVAAALRPGYRTTVWSALGAEAVDGEVVGE